MSEQKDEKSHSGGGGMASKWAGFRQFLWNNETKEVAGRTARSWAEITLFFIVLYVFLAVFWVGLLYLVQLRLPSVENGPLYSDYLTHRGPGLHLVPSAQVVGRDKQKIFRMENKDHYMQQIEQFLANHTDLSNLGDCNQENFAKVWDEGNLCFYFYMNAIHNFVPEPQDGKVTIQCSASKSNYKKFFDNTTTYPSDGFDVSKFPWTYGVNWDKTAPIVAAKVKMNSEEFKNLAEARLNCQIVAANVHIDHEKPNIGMVDFRIKAIKD